MFTSTIILAGTVLVEGRPVRWWVTDGLTQRLTVSHPVYGTEAQRLVRSPAVQARSIGQAMLASKAQPPTGFLEAVDDTPLPEGDPEPTIF
jgi:hypothetical protein